jgi:hypothetical protein
MNGSDEAAENVRLVVAGSGKADILDCDCGTPDLDKAPVEWKNQISLGSVPPHGRAQVLIWPDRAIVRSVKNVGILHARGTGVVREWQKFYGWDSEFVSWFLVQPAFVRYGSAIVGAVLFIALFVILHRRGHIVLRRRPIGVKNAVHPEP